MKKLLLALLLALVPTLAQAASCATYGFTLQNNTTADATQVMANFNTVRGCVINNAASLGANADITSLSGLTTPLTPAQGGTSVFIGGTSTGSANAQVVATTTPTTFALVAGYRMTFIAGFTNTGATTMNGVSSGATAVRKPSPSGPIALSGGEIVAGNVVELIYDGTYLILLGYDQADFNTSTSLAGATTTDLGTIPSHNVSISGSGAVITGFGSTAVASSPIYLIKFAGANTLTYNASSLIIPGSANITTAANDTAVVEYLGSGNWQVLSYTRRTGAGIIPVSPLCGANGLTIQNNSGTPNTNVDMAAGSVVMVDTSAVTVTASSVSVTVNGTTTGANGLDAGSLANGTWYYFYLINNGTTTAGLASTSSTAPTMPSGYTFKCRLGAKITDGSANFFRTVQSGPRAAYKVVSATNTASMKLVSNGAVGTYSSTTSVTYGTASVASIVPPTATTINLTLIASYNNDTNSHVLVAPNTSYGAPSSTNPPVIRVDAASSLVSYGEIVLEGTTIAVVASAAGGGVFCSSYTDSVNAN